MQLHKDFDPIVNFGYTNCIGSLFLLIDAIELINQLRCCEVSNPSVRNGEFDSQLFVHAMSTKNSRSVD